MPTLPLPALLDPERRTFLKVGIAGALLLTLSRRLPAAPDGAPVAVDVSPLAHLTAADVIALERIVPVMLAGALPEAAKERALALAEIIRGIDRTIEHQPPSVRQEVRDLFGLLTRGATRALVAGIWTSWDKASNDDIAEFLSGWRASRFALLRSAYIGLNHLIMASWYGNPKSWARIGYAGPPGIT